MSDILSAEEARRLYENSIPKNIFDLIKRICVGDHTNKQVILNTNDFTNLLTQYEFKFKPNTITARIDYLKNLGYQVEEKWIQVSPKPNSDGTIPLIYMTAPHYIIKW